MKDNVVPILGQNVPLVGQLVEAFDCVPVVTARCKCKPDNKPFMLMGSPVVCNECLAVYAVVQVAFDARTGMAPIARVGKIGQAARKDGELKVEG